MDPMMFKLQMGICEKFGREKSVVFAFEILTKVIMKENSHMLFSFDSLILQL
jgi:hypothetical protein